MNEKRQNTSDTPQLSVILMSRGDYAEIRRTVRHFARQTIADAIELVLVSLPGPNDAPDERDMAAFHSHRVVRIDAMPSTAAARAAGILNANAPYVAFGEEHSHPDPAWAETLTRTLDEGFVAAGPGMHNANPRTALSWANMLPEYGLWMARKRDDEIDHIPGHNGSYRRDILLEYGDRLEEMLIAESVLHWDQRAKGRRLCLQPEARTYHLNMSRWRPTIGLRFRVGRVFAAKRAAAWPVLKRIAFAIGSPLIPLVRFRRTVADARRIGKLEQLPRGTLLATFVTLTFDSLGEATGYVIGQGNALDMLTEFEFDREAYLTAEDRASLAAEGTA
jgi:hypothetical protein